MPVRQTEERNRWRHNSQYSPWVHAFRLASVQLVMYSVKDDLSELDRHLFRGNRIVIPRLLRRGILSRTHDGHQGIVKCRELANECVWWPCIVQEIKDMISKYKACIEKKPSHKKESLIPSSLPWYPFQKAGVDICEKKGKNYLVAIDYYSRYIELELAKLSMTTSAAVIQELKEIFERQGILEVLVSNNGSQFSTLEFKDFIVRWDITHVTSSLKFPKSNGEAESCADCEADAGSARCFSCSSVLQVKSNPFPWSQSCRASTWQKSLISLPSSKTWSTSRFTLLSKRWTRVPRSYRNSTATCGMVCSHSPIYSQDRQWEWSAITRKAGKNLAGW